MTRPRAQTVHVLRVGVAVWIAFALMIVKADQGMSEPSLDNRTRGLSSDFSYASKYIEVLGSKLHYIDQGQGAVFLFLHGNPTSSYLWRNVMRYVAPQGRIVAVDNIGFGKSDKPKVDYTLQTHLRYTEAFIHTLDLRHLILVAHDWGAALGLDYAARHPGNVKGVVFMEAVSPPAFPMETLDDLGRAANLFRRFRDPVAGKKALIDDNLFLEVLMVNATMTRQMTAKEMDVYRAPFLESAK